MSTRVPFTTITIRAHLADPRPGEPLYQCSHRTTSSRGFQPRFRDPLRRSGATLPTVTTATGSTWSLMDPDIDISHIDRVLERVALHPGTAVFGFMDEDVRPWTGTVQALYSDQFADLDAGYGFRFETVPLHQSLAFRA